MDHYIWKSNYFRCWHMSTHLSNALCLVIVQSVLYLCLLSGHAMTDPLGCPSTWVSELERFLRPTKKHKLLISRSIKTAGHNSTGIASWHEYDKGCGSIFINWLKWLLLPAPSSPSCFCCLCLRGRSGCEGLNDGPPLLRIKRNQS